MADLPQPWDTYAHHQATLARGYSVSDRSWGTEAAMNRILGSLEDTTPLTIEEIARAAASESRRERHRAHLRAIYLSGSDVSLQAQAEEAFFFAHELRLARSKLSEEDWALLCQVAAGHSYEDIAAANGCSVGGLRVRVLRCRRLTRQ